ncbi:MAG: GNAT family N-acetyltransferase [Rikenellaceae bacterium]|jgi:diamine N-acetyltransferase|nr:GNAT family N-acetyltransferase [Rikenellaceae bacterium]
MTSLTGKLLRLRTLEPEDLEYLYRWENDPGLWGVSHTLAPFSRHILKQFIENQTLDIYQTRQTRFIIESLADGAIVGAVDLFEFDPYQERAGIGILVYDPADRCKGYAREAVGKLCEYCFEVLGMRQVWCNIAADNAPSIALFEECGFIRCGVKRGWLRTREGQLDEYMYQRLNPDKKF